AAMLGQSPGMGFQHGFQPHAFNEQSWSLAKYTSLSGHPKVNIEGNVRAVFSMHRRQLVVWHENTIMINVDLHHAKTSIPTKEVYAIIKENNISLCRLKFRSLPDRVSFGAALADLVHVSNDKSSSQDPSSQGWQNSSQGASSSQTDFTSSQGRSGMGVESMGGGHNWSSPHNPSPSYMSSSQPIIGTSSAMGSQSWKMTPPNSQSSSQQFKSLMQPPPVHTPELRMERTEWSTPLKRPIDTHNHTVAKRKREEPSYTNARDTSFSSSVYSDSDSFNDSFSSVSSQTSDFSSQPLSQPMMPVLPTMADASTECVVERSEMSTQTDSSLYPTEEDLPTLLKYLLEHPEFVSFTNLISTQIDGNEELSDLIDKNFPLEEEDDEADKTRPLEEEKEDESNEKGNTGKDVNEIEDSGNESDQSDIIDL
ncbi:hypothetical protein PFISCL1PPCAC_19701, partial [Pristionchus fissidentatus]